MREKLFRSQFSVGKAYLGSPERGSHQMVQRTVGTAIASLSKLRFLCLARWSASSAHVSEFITPFDQFEHLVFHLLRAATR
jgi:hypothetical protein